MSEKIFSPRDIVIVPFPPDHFPVAEVTETSPTLGVITIRWLDGILRGCREVFRIKELRFPRSPADVKSSCKPSLWREVAKRICVECDGHADKISLRECQDAKYCATLGYPQYCKLCRCKEFKNAAIVNTKKA